MRLLLAALLLGSTSVTFAQTGSIATPAPDSVTLRLQEPAPAGSRGAGVLWQPGSASVQNVDAGSKAGKSRGGTCMLVYRFDVVTQHNYRENGVLGMAIMPKFTIFNAEGRPMKAVAYFYNSNGPLTDDNGSFRTISGNVSSSATFTPGYYQTLYNSQTASDLYIFIPYPEISKYSGTYYFKVLLWDGQDSGANSIYESGFYTFTITY
ncbi:MAG: hypothetical protein EOO08_12115 [Chitinophagaceae bacterium]|nr:MAG: hypothetical protein EOO08_12115 [Chitinophagaceae bacterium]